MKHRSLLLTVSVCLFTGILLAAFIMPSSVRRSHANETNSRWAGAYVDGYPGWPRNTPALDNFAAQVGKMPAVVMYYTDWQHDGFTTDVAQTIHDRGATPMITWLPSGDDPSQYSLLSIINGAHDTYIHHFAQQAAAWGHPFFLRFAHEMNGNWYPWSAGTNGNTPDQYAAAWRHVHDIFQAEGANQYAIWVWSPNVDVGAPYTPVPMQQFYPGDQYVDWTALDGYNWGYEPSWQSFGEVFGKSYQILAALSAKPMMIGEMAAADNDGTHLNGVDKGGWIRDAYLNAIPNSYPRIQGVIWFNQQKERLWQVNSSQGALDAYREVMASPSWNQSVPVSSNPSSTAPVSTPTYVPLVLTQPAANLALNKPVTASGMCNGAQSPAKAVNGSVKSGNDDKWCANDSAPHYLQVDLGTTAQITRVVVQHAGAGGEQSGWNTRDFALLVSLDGVTWTTVANIVGNTNAVTEHSISPIAARFVRLLIITPSSNGNNAARIYEFEVYA